MNKSIIYNISYEEYIKLISKIESTFTNYKQTLSILNIKLYHPSVAVSLFKKDILVLTETFPEECKSFGDASNFYNCLLLVNYHIGSLLQVVEILDTNEVKTISISLEDLLILDSFNKFVI